MNYVIERGADSPAYMQLYRQLRGDILSGALPLGAKLPSKRTLAEELGLSLITVEHACALLADEGYIETRERSGAYVSFGGAAGREKPLAVPSPAPAGSSAPQDFPFTSLAKTMRRVLTVYDRRILERSPGSGVWELRAAIAAYIARSRGLVVDPERIVVGAGAEYLYGLIVQFFGAGTRFALEEPCYARIRQVYEANGAHCEGLPMGADGIVSRALEHCDAGVLHVTPFNSYPSRVTASASKRHEYARWARARNACIVEDDYDAELASVTKHIETICSLAPERVLYLNTFSRSFAPSMRTAYLVLPEALAEPWQEKLGFYSCAVPVFEQYVLAEFLNGGELERYISRRRRKLRQQRDLY